MQSPFGIHGLSGDDKSSRHVFVPHVVHVYYINCRTRFNFVSTHDKYKRHVLDSFTVPYSRFGFSISSSRALLNKDPRLKFYNAQLSRT